MDLSAFELSALRVLTAGDHPIFAQLQRQLPALTVVERKVCQVGFLTTPAVDPRLEKGDSFDGDVNIGDVAVEVEELTYPANLTLFVRRGRIHSLEGTTVEDTWPSIVRQFNLYYVDDMGDGTGSAEVPTRSLSKALGTLYPFGIRV